MNFSKDNTSYTAIPRVSNTTFTVTYPDDNFRFTVSGRVDTVNTNRTIFNYKSNTTMAKGGKSKPKGKGGKC